MKYYLDTEFLEGSQKKTFLGIPIGRTKPTIDLISVGLVSEDGREYYAISKDFNLNEAWNRFDLKPVGFKDYWIRNNILFPIYRELFIREKAERLYLNTPSEIKSHIKLVNEGEINYDIPNFKYCKKDFIRLINKYGKTNKEIAEGVFNFINPDLGFHVTAYNNSELKQGGKLYDYFNDHNVTDINGHFYAQPEFYTYYGDYDWVVFCWLFGKMIDLPKGFPMYSKDLKQIFDDVALKREREWMKDSPNGFNMSNHLKTLSEYPQKTNEHNALYDAKWNKKLHEFLINVQPI